MQICVSSNQSLGRIVLVLLLVHLQWPCEMSAMPQQRQLGITLGPLLRRNHAGGSLFSQGSWSLVKHIKRISWRKCIFQMPIHGVKRLRYRLLSRVLCIYKEVLDVYSEFLYLQWKRLFRIKSIVNRDQSTVFAVNVAKKKKGYKKAVWADFFPEP